MNMLGYSYFLLPLLVIGLFSLIPVYAEPQELHIVEGTNLEIMIDDIQKWKFDGFDIFYMDLTLTNHHNEDLIVTSGDLIIVDEDGNKFRGGFNDETIPECGNPFSHFYTLTPTFSETVTGLCIKVPSDDRFYEGFIYEEKNIWCTQEDNCKFTKYGFTDDEGKQEIQKPDYVKTNQISIEYDSGLLGCEDTFDCYLPWRIIIENGDTVTWTNNDSVSHTVSSGESDYFGGTGYDGGFDSGLISPGETFSVTFLLDEQDSDVYPYYCLVHPWMDGVVKIEFPNTEQVENPDPELLEKPEKNPKKSIPSFVDPEKDPWSYVERYENEPEYRDWFDRNYPDYTIYEAVGLPEQIKEKIPDWIKNNAKWWSDDQIDDDTFVSGIQFLIKEKIIDIPNLPPQASEITEQKVPDWIKNNAKWWSDGMISEDDFVKGIEYLVEKGIISVQ